MKYLRTARVAAVVVAAALGFGAQASLSGAEEPVEGVYGMVEAIDPLEGFDWAPPVQDREVAAAVADGATVTDEPCTFGDRPGVLDPQREIFRRPIQTTGHLVVTPSGNASFHCHAAANAGSFQRPLPTAAIVVDRVSCFLPDRRRDNDARLVVTPSLHVHLSCHIQPTS
jgi:hypothetical protein